jgi:small-conductance mechanosensitive channel
MPIFFENENFPLMETFQYFLFLLCVVVAASALAFFIRSRFMGKSSFLRNRFSIFIFVLVVAGVIVALKLSPDDIRPHLLTLIGILVSAGIALSSATFISNAMSGLMIQVIRNFRHGNFIRVGDFFGRVSRLGLLHTEIQTEERRLINIPNLFLVKNPVTVIGDDGAVVSAKVSLGYNVPNKKVEQILGKAAIMAGLCDPFVQILELGNYSVTYRCSGILQDPRIFFTAQSVLRAKMLDQLHENGIEIVSPTFMNQRILAEDSKTIPERTDLEKFDNESKVELGIPENLIFDKADLAARGDELNSQIRVCEDELFELKSRLEQVNAEEDIRRVNCQIKQKQMQLDRLKAALKKELSKRKL